jgi:hypothetical protein
MVLTLYTPKFALLAVSCFVTTCTFMGQLAASDDPATLNREGQVVVKANKVVL